MEQTRLIMGMPITVEIVDKRIDKAIFSELFEFFKTIDKRFSTYKKNSEISLLNKGKISKDNISTETKEVFSLAEKTKKQTNGYFNIYHQGLWDPSGIVKGWAILKASKLLKRKGYKNFYIDAGGDIEVSGKNSRGESWKVGIKNPFNQKQIVKILKLKNRGVATSGNYIRGEHIYNPKGKNKDEVISLTIIGPNICEADRFATAAFAMGKKGIYFIEGLEGFEGYLIDKNGIGTQTSGLNKYLI